MQMLFALHPHAACIRINSCATNLVLVATVPNLQPVPQLFFSLMRWRYFFLLLGVCAPIATGIGIWKIKIEARNFRRSISSGENGNFPAFISSPCAIALVPHRGDEKIDYEIRQLQQQARSDSEAAGTIKRLGWGIYYESSAELRPGILQTGRSMCALCAIEVRR